MKSVLDAATRAELINRIQSLSTQHAAQWGKMNVYEMIGHCSRCDDMFLGKLKIKRVLIGRLIGGLVFKKLLKEDKPFGRNSPTSPLLKTTGQIGDIETAKTEWLGRINSYSNYDNPGFVHPFFGPMTREQVGLFAYKHADHHLRQFGA